MLHLDELGYGMGDVVVPTLADVQAWTDRQAFDYVQSNPSPRVTDSAAITVIAQKYDRYMYTTDTPETRAIKADIWKNWEGSRYGSFEPWIATGNGGTATATVWRPTIPRLAWTGLLLAAATGVGVWLMMRGKG
jgi:hypothetical protein